jgi:hypothetical protein
MNKNILFVTAFAALTSVGTACAIEPVKISDDSRYSFSYKCNGFRVSVDGHNTGWHTIYFDNAGNKVQNVAHHSITETHRNLRTDRTVEFRGNYQSTFDYVANTQTFTGAYLLANERLDGTLLQETGLVEVNYNTGEIRTAGQHDILKLPYDPFCAALAG